MFPSSLSCIDAFDIFVDCFVYGSIAYFVMLFVVELIITFLDLVEEHQSSEADFYQQVKELLNPSELIDFEALTIRQLRDYIRENQLHNSVRQHIGKSVSSASKQDLITALQ